MMSVEGEGALAALFFIFFGGCWFGVVFGVVLVFGGFFRFFWKLFCP
jgi:hypothetical protein